MAWKNKSLRYSSQNSAENTQNEFMKVNKLCFIRKNHQCGKLVGASKSCFIACPTDDEIEPILGLISEKLTKVGIEPIIAVKERAYGQDIFCTKICGKIIESKFCIAILDDTPKNGENIPSPNVYYEYGLMTSLGKHIIPLQKDSQTLAFNIQSYDTIKYNAKNIGNELDRAIKDAIKITEAEKQNEETISITDKTILRKFELSNFVLKDDSWFLYDAINDTNFKGFGNHQKGFYLYLGKIDSQEDFNNYLEDLNIIIFRTEKEAEEVLNQRDIITKEINKVPPGSVQSVVKKRRNEEELADIEERLQLMSQFYIAFVIDPKLDKRDFVKNVNSQIVSSERFKVVYSDKGILDFDGIKVEFNNSQLLSQIN